METIFEVKDSEMPDSLKGRSRSPKRQGPTVKGSSGGLQGVEVLGLPVLSLEEVFGSKGCYQPLQTQAHLSFRILAVLLCYNSQASTLEGKQAKQS